MTPVERRASGSLATVFAARMLGLFLVLPVFALEAARYPGGTDPALVGLAMGIYGLTQGILQIPFGMASDRLGRKRVIIFGLLVFAAGSFMAAAAQTLGWLIAGRSLQGAGAVSAAVTALLADQTRDEVRTKAMALVGASIGLMFALSLVVAPLLVAQIGPGRAVRGDRRPGAGLHCRGGVVDPARAGAAQERAARQTLGSAQSSRAAAPGRGRFRAARGAAGDVGGDSGAAGTGRPAQGSSTGTCTFPPCWLRSWSWA